MFANSGSVLFIFRGKMVIKVLATEIYFLKCWERPGYKEILENGCRKKVMNLK
jgi:hypothetical protein